MVIEFNMGPSIVGKEKEQSKWDMILRITCVTEVEKFQKLDMLKFGGGKSFEIWKELTHNQIIKCNSKDFIKCILFGCFHVFNIFKCKFWGNKDMPFTKR